MELDRIIDYNLSLVFKAENYKIQTNYFENPIGKKMTYTVRANEFAKYLVNENLITIDGSFCFITRKGKKISENGGWLKYLNEQNKKEEHEIDKISLEYENLKLQKKVSLLTVENLTLQNRQLKRYIIYSIIGFVMGAFISNIKNVMILLKSYL